MTTHSSTTLADFIEIMAHENPDEVISTFKNEMNVYSMNEINKKATLLAKGLLYNGVEKGTPVGLLISCTSSCLTFVLALSKIGAVIIPIDEEVETLFLENLLLNEKIQTLGFYDHSFLKIIKEMIPEYCHNERGYLQCDRYPSLKNIVSFGSVKNRGIFTSRELMLLGMHMDDIEMETRVKSISFEDVFIKQVFKTDNSKFKVNTIKHGDIITSNFTFSALQNLLNNSV